MTYRVLAMDPGKANFGVSIQDMAVSKGQLKVKVVGAQMLDRPIDDMKVLAKQARAFEANIWHLEHLYGPFDFVVAERLQARGLKGTTIETINAMLGRMTHIFPQLEVYTASMWKNAYNRAVPIEFEKKGKTLKPLDSTYERLKEVTKPRAVKDRHQVHELDCTLMGQYHVAQKTGLVTYAHLDSEKRVLAFLKHFDASPRL